MSGLLGSNLAFAYRDTFDVLGTYHAYPFRREDLKTVKIDILSRMDIRGIVKEFRPQVVIHCAALANIEECEKNPDLAQKLNRLGTQILTEVLKDTDAKLIYISTDSVYDGEHGHFKETDPIRPLSRYSQSKYEGELQVLRKLNSLIVRTAFFGWNIQDKTSLAEWVVRELSLGKTINGFTDVITSSIYTFKLAELLKKAIKKDLRGIYHFASSTAISKYEFAVKLAELFGFSKELINPMSVDYSQLMAKRSKNLSLNVEKLARDLAGEIPTMEESLKAFYKDYKAGVPDFIKSKNKLAEKLAKL